MDVLERLKRRIPEEKNEALLEDILESAKNEILLKRYPFHGLSDDAHKDEWKWENNKYEELQLQIAIRMYNKLGAEGEIAHNENGISRQYGSVTGYDDLLAKVIPKGAVI